MAWTPRVWASAPNMLSIGQMITLSRKESGANLPQDIKDKLAHVEQMFKVEVGLGTSIEEVMTSEDALMKLAAKGFSVKASYSLIHNMRKALMKITEDTEDD